MVNTKFFYTKGPIKKSNKHAIKATNLKDFRILQKSI